MRSVVQHIALALMLSLRLYGVASAQVKPLGAAQRDAAVPLAGTELSNPSDLARPSELVYASGRLVVVDGQGDDQVLVYDAPSGRLLKKFGREGAGPGEFRVPWSAQATPADSCCAWIYDAELRRFTLIDILSDESRVDRVTRRVATLSSGMILMSVAWLNQRQLVATGILTEPARFAITDSLGRPIRYGGALPKAAPGVPPGVWQHAYQSTVAVRPDGRRFAIATRHADRLEIYSATGELVAEAPRRHRFEPQFTVAYVSGSPTMASGSDMRYGYVDAAANQDRVFVLYSGQSLGDAPSRAWFGQEVYEYDWDGNALRAFQLPVPVLAIAVTADGRRLFALQHDPLPALVQFVIPREARH